MKKALKNVSIPISIIMMAAVFCITFDLKDDIKGAIDIMLAIAFAVSLMLTGISVHRVAELLKMLSLKKRILSIVGVVLGLVALTGLSLVWAMLTPMIPGDFRISLYDYIPVIIIIGCCIAFAQLVAATISLAVRPLKEKKSVKYTATVVLGIAAVIALLITVSFFRMCTFVDEADIGYYLIAASIFLFTFVCLVLLTLGLYTKRAKLFFLKEFTLFLLCAVTLCFTLVGLLEYDYEETYDQLYDPVNFIKAEVCVLFMGLDGDGIVYIGKTSAGKPLYLAANNNCVYNFEQARIAEAKAAGKDVENVVTDFSTRERPFAGMNCFEYYDPF